MDKKTIFLASHLCGLRSKKEMEQFLEGILSPNELESISTRIKIIKMLKDKTPQRLIAEKLGVGIATVTRGAKELKTQTFPSIK